MNNSGDPIGSASCKVVESEEQSVALIEDAIHQLAQPLTALSFTLDLALCSAEPEGWRRALVSARTECRRAVVALDNLRVSAFPETSVEHGYDRAAGELL